MTDRRHDHQDQTPVTLEVEVTEIDGVTRSTPPPDASGPRSSMRRASDPGAPADGTWTRAGRYVRTLDARWWPLWIFLGIIALVLALTVGLALAFIYLVFRALLAVLRWIFG